MKPVYKQIDNFYFDANSPIGRGAFATVFKATHRKLRNKAAVKVVACAELSKNQDTLSFFMRELNILHRISGEHIAQLLDVKKTDHNLYIFTEYCDGGDLETKLKSQKRFTEEEALLIVKQIASAFISLENSHITNESGRKVTLMHRDIKPANILFHQGKVKIADFGFSKFIEDDLKNIKQTNTLLGTPLYMAPQVLNNEQFSTKCDIWSAGILLYQIIFGKLPWIACSASELYKNIKSQPLTFPCQVSDETKDLIKKMLSIDEKDRVCWNDVYNHPALKKNYVI